MHGCNGKKLTASAWHVTEQNSWPQRPSLPASRVQYRLSLGPKVGLLQDLNDFRSRRATHSPAGSSSELPRRSTRCRSHGSSSSCSTETRNTSVDGRYQGMHAKNRKRSVGSLNRCERCNPHRSLELARCRSMASFPFGIRVLHAMLATPQGWAYRTGLFPWAPRSVDIDGESLFNTKGGGWEMTIPHKT